MAHTGWALLAGEPTRLAQPTRAALVKLARRVTRKVAGLTVVAGPGRPWSTKPVGTRMGKGKGKTTARVGWLPRGGSALAVAASPTVAGRLRRITRRGGAWRVTPTWW